MTRYEIQRSFVGLKLWLPFGTPLTLDLRERFPGPRLVACLTDMFPQCIELLAHDGLRVANYSLQVR